MLESLESRVRKVISEVFAIPVEQVRKETTQHDIKNWDSTNVLHLILSLESEFGMTFDVDELTEFTSVETILSIIKRKDAGQ